MTMQVDEVWLKSLKFHSFGGTIVNGILGHGAEKVVYSGITPDGKEVALAHLKPHLGYYIREIPPQLTGTQMYNLDTLNEKLAALVGDPLIDQASYSSNRLHANLAKLVWDKDLTPILLSSASKVNLIESIPYIIRTSGFRLRFEDWSTLTPDKKLSYIDVNRPFLIQGFHDQVPKKASEILNKLDANANSAGGYDNLSEDPYYVWLVAVMDGFYGNEQLEIAAKFMMQRFGSITEDVNAGSRIQKVTALVDAYSYFFADAARDVPALRRAVHFLAKASCIIEVCDKEGKRIAHGFDALK